MSYSELKSFHGFPFGPELDVIHEVMDMVTIPVIGRVRTGHKLEAMGLQAGLVNLIEEVEYVDAGATEDHIQKHPFKIPFIAEASNLKEALQRITEGASIIRTKFDSDEDAGTSKAIDYAKKIFDEIGKVADGDVITWSKFASESKVPIDLIRMIARLKKLPVPFFGAGNIFLPVDAALLMSMGCDGVIVTSRIFMNVNPEARLRAMKDAIENYDDPDVAVTLMEEMEGMGISYWK
ncbi:hypothetical protein H4R24_005626 [Coemansia sp. RSA 988]|nr:hypothetical protein H4R24_005626 [Coemansia sp. RSA 988]